MSQDDIETDPILLRLEEGREKLGGLGEPIWSQAMMQYRLNMSRLHAAEEDQTFVLDELDACRKAYRALETEREELREELRVTKESLLRALTSDDAK